MSDETTSGRGAVSAVEDTLRSDRLDQTASGCFTDDGAAAYLDGSLGDTARDRMRAHLDGCEHCRALVLYAARGIGKVDATGETAPFAKPADPPHRIGRFTILELIGVGGMGVVYAAFDSELDRKVALKLVRTELRDEKPEATRQAMLREAKAMAKVDHPNVITVFEVGTHEDQIFVAMELVTGGDLRAWMKAAPRSWRDSLAICRQAGLGLAAAHRAGLVHRDFKPDNVLVGSDGRVRVTDFGLARAVDDRTRPTSDAGSATFRPSDRLTRTGAIVGTPAYMAPEQHRGEPADARSDQFAFCVTVWEALYGERPFAGDNYAEIAANVIENSIRDAPRESEVPPKVRDALRRGLCTAPSDRFAGMDDLLAELAVQPPRKRKLLLLVAAPVAVAAGIATWMVANDDPSEVTCPTSASKLAGVWDAGRREATRKALSDVAPFGADIAARTTSALDAYTVKWASAWSEACAANARGEQSPTMFDMRVACLTRRLRSIDAVAGAFAKREVTIAVRAGELIDNLAPIEACNDTEALARSAPPPALLPKIAAIDDTIEKVEVQRLAGSMDEARKLADQALVESERIAYRPEIGRALYTIALLEQDAGDYAAAEKTLQRASTAAMSSSSDELTAQVLIELADIVGYELARPAEAHRLVEIARGAIERIGNPPKFRLELLTTESRLSLAEGKHEPALAALDEATVIANQLGDEAQLIPLLSGKGLILVEQGRFDEAFALVEQQLVLRERVEGKRHPNYAAALEARSTIHFARNAFEAGLADLAAARRIKIDALGPDSPELLTVENNAGVIAGLLGDWQEALRSARTTLAISEKQFGDDHPSSALATSNIGAALRELGQLDEAEPHTLRALEIRKKVLGEHHADVAVSLTEVGELRLAQGRPKDAVPQFRDASKILIDGIGEESPLIPYATSGLGRAQLALGDAQAARATLAASLKRLDELELDPVLNAKTRLALAEATWQLGDRAAARKLAGETAAPLDKLPKGSQRALRAKIESWIAKHR